MDDSGDSVSSTEVVRRLPLMTSGDQSIASSGASQSPNITPGIGQLGPSGPGGMLLYTGAQFAGVSVSDIPELPLDLKQPVIVAEFNFMEQVVEENRRIAQRKISKTSLPTRKQVGDSSFSLAVTDSSSDPPDLLDQGEQKYIGVGGESPAMERDGKGVAALTSPGISRRPNLTRRITTTAATRSPPSTAGTGSASPHTVNDITSDEGIGAVAAAPNNSGSSAELELQRSSLAGYEDEAGNLTSLLSSKPNQSCFSLSNFIGI
ncbi:hypothetical protein Ciccas_005852 [Cichlidogyrus casuarinus]|uniref:Uncharacterized protein n=1 Tax=Cichlidogyrus casuarinus TaxID=1844966 RepID=A0ABD2QB58_9PLAT